MDGPTEGRVHASTRERARQVVSSVEAAALSGVAAAVLFTVAAFLLARQPGVRSGEQDPAWYTDPGHQRLVLVGLNLVPLAVVALLWFMAVVRRRLGEREDQLFSTVFFASGVAFAVLAMVAAVVVAAPTLTVRLGTAEVPDQETVDLAHSMWVGLWGVAASRMVGVFMAATSTVGLRFGAFPHWLGAFGVVIGVCLGITGAFIGPLDFLFPLWLAVVSITLLVSGRKRREAMSPPDPA